MSSESSIDRCLHWNLILSFWNSNVNSSESSAFGIALNKVVYGYLSFFGVYVLDDGLRRKRRSEVRCWKGERG